MANEFVLIHETHKAIPFTVADGTAITKGALLQLTDPMTASISTVAEQVIAGIAAESKLANDGHTKIGVYRRGIFRAKLSGIALFGQELTGKTAATGANEVQAHSGLTVAQISGARIIGHSLETGATGDTIIIDVDIQGTGNG